MRLPWWLPLGSVPEIEAGNWLSDWNLNPICNSWMYAQKANTQVATLPARGSVPIQSFRQTYPSLGLDPDQPVMVVCLSSHRSLPAVRLLNNDGYDSYQLANGMNAWIKEGLPTITN